jgi:phosphatidylglycerol:prolipoprotein diacylglycerol transferase
MFPILQLGPLAVQTPGLILLLGIWVSLAIAEKQAHKAAVAPALVYNMVLAGLLFGILGARLTYVAQHLSAFIAAPLSILSLTPTMLDPAGGILVAAIAMLVYGQRKNLSLFPALDALTPFFMVMLLFIGLANLASGDGFGLPTHIPWGFELWGAFRHPSQVYDILAALLILALVWRARSPRDIPGNTFFRFLALASAARLFLEAYRGDSVMLTTNLRLAQVVAWLLLGLALWQLGKLIKLQKEADDELDR